MTIREWIDTEFEEVVVCDGFDDALLGVATGCARPDTAIYDAHKIIEILIERDGMSEEEAEEFFSFNIEGAYVDGAPLFLRRPPEEP